MSTVSNKEVFTFKKVDENGKEYGDDITLCVKRPSPEDGRRAQVYYNKTFAETLTAGGLLRDRVSVYMRDQGLWDDAKEAQQKDFVKRLSDMELKLKGGGIKLSDARKLALQMREVRNEFRKLLSTKNSLDVSTVEGQAENARFNALVAFCLVYNDSGKPYYSSVDDYLEHAASYEAFQGASLLGQMLFTLDKNYEANLPENKFLQRFKFVNNDLNLINKDSQLVDEDGRLIDATGRFIAYTTDADGKKTQIFVDKNGLLVDADGNYVVSEQPFLDDDGNPIEAPTESAGAAS